MSSEQTPRAPAAAPSAETPFIDWGPSLPARYGTGRARLLVANPETLYLTWESSLEAPSLWRIELARKDEPTIDFVLDGKSEELWLKVTPASVGEVRLFREEALVASLPFETPRAAPAELPPFKVERWASVHADQAPSDIDPPAGQPAPQHGFSVDTLPTSSRPTST